MVATFWYLSNFRATFGYIVKHIFLNLLAQSIHAYIRGRDDLHYSLDPMLQYAVHMFKIWTVIHSLTQVRLTFLRFSSLHLTQTTYHNVRWLFSGFVLRRIAINGQVWHHIQHRGHRDCAQLKSHFFVALC